MNKTPAFDLTPTLFTKALGAHATASSLYLRFSGYDPRSAGGRQTLKLELRGELAPSIKELSFRFRSDLLSALEPQRTLLRTPAGLWPPLILSFSSKHMEHGQYLLEIELQYKEATGESHRWICTTTLLLPRANASLSEIHQVFLATQKNVRIVAEDGAIAKLNGLQQPHDAAHANLDIAIYAKDAAIAQLDMHNMLDMTATSSRENGKFNIGLSSIAWDEELLEVAVPSYQSLTGRSLAAALPRQVKRHVASLSANKSPTIRLFALEQWVLGRRDAQASVANILLQHRDAALTKRISARHACLRRTETGALELIDTSRYGVVVDGQIVDKHQAQRLLVGMHIELCASIKGIVQLRVAQILPHAVMLEHLAGAQVVELLYLIIPEILPDTSLHVDLNAQVFFHHRGQFWHRDSQTQQDRQLDVDSDLSSCHESLRAYRYSHQSYPDLGS